MFVIIPQLPLSLLHSLGLGSEGVVTNTTSNFHVKFGALRTLKLSISMGRSLVKPGMINVVIALSRPVLQRV